MIRAHDGPEAAASAATMGAEVYATGGDVVLGPRADLFTVAHEAAHVVQQRAGGLHATGGVGARGDADERHADAVAERVVRGESAEALLDGGAAAVGGAVVQRKVTLAHEERSVEVLKNLFPGDDRAQQVVAEVSAADVEYGFDNEQELIEVVKELAKTSWGPPPGKGGSEGERVKGFAESRLDKHWWASDNRGEGRSAGHANKYAEQATQGRAVLRAMMQAHFDLRSA